MAKKDKIQHCYNCVKYKQTCDGESQFKVVPPKTTCENLDNGAKVIESRTQVEGFQLSFRMKMKTQNEPLMAFVEAIVETSDDRFEEAKKYRGSKIDKYETLTEMKGKQMKQSVMKKVKCRVCGRTSYAKKGSDMEVSKLCAGCHAKGK